MVSPWRRICPDDVDAVRERVHIEDVVGEHVTLRPGGVDSLKGLCPFHDEKSPSFHVRPQIGRYHCFGCGEDGDAIAFVRKIGGFGFAEAVEYLAATVGLVLRYEDGSAVSGSARLILKRVATPAAPIGVPATRDPRLLGANRAAQAFFAAHLLRSDAAGPARELLAGRGFGKAAADRFGVGYAPKGWDNLTRHLTGRGFTTDELVGAGLAATAEKNPGRVYDRFRGRVTWPIRDAAGEVIGFGARRLFDDDQGPKYLNTPETSLYRKAQVLYGLDAARRAIATSKRVVVVEGYTDVMAMHLAGETTAVATCGTAFGPEQAWVLRELVGVEGEAVLCFDGDAAGQVAGERAAGIAAAAGLRASVAVLPGGMDPNELWLAAGPQALRALVGTLAGHAA